MNSETLQKLLADGLAVMRHDDPARPRLAARLHVIADSPTPFMTLSFYDYSSTPIRECCGSGSTPEEALAIFGRDYKAPLTVQGRIAELESELAKLKGQVS